MHSNNKVRWLKKSLSLIIDYWLWIGFGWFDWDIIWKGYMIAIKTCI